MLGGLGQGTESLTGVLEATVRDPSRSGPGARLIHGLAAQGKYGVDRQPADIFTPARRPQKGSED